MGEKKKEVLKTKTRTEKGKGMGVGVGARGHISGQQKTSSQRTPTPNKAEPRGLVFLSPADHRLTPRLKSTTEFKLTCWERKKCLHRIAFRESGLKRGPDLTPVLLLLPAKIKHGQEK